MEQEHYEMNIENWANSIIKLEENSYTDNIQSQSSVNLEEEHALVSLATPTYYRSKAFSSTVGINSLINAADPVLTLVTKLRKITIPPEVSILHQNICHEIKAFENRAQTLGFRSQVILAARYVICALLDELIDITLWPDTEWNKYSLIETFHKDTWEEDRFFLILERSLQDAAGHIDLLELIYLCLRLGYEGKFRGMDRGLIELRNITDNLYSIITHHRDEFSRGLLISLDNTNYHQAKKKPYTHLLPPAWIISTLMVLSLIFVFTFFYYKLVETASPIAKVLKSFESVQETIELQSTAK